MIHIQLNDENHQIPSNQSLHDLLLHHPFPVAVALNNQFIPRTSYAMTFLQEGDRVDIITPMQGG